MGVHKYAVHTLSSATKLESRKLSLTVDTQFIYSTNDECFERLCHHMNASMLTTFSPKLQCQTEPSTSPEDWWVWIERKSVIASVRSCHSVTQNNTCSSQQLTTFHSILSQFPYANLKGRSRLSTGNYIFRINISMQGYKKGPTF